MAQQVAPEIGTVPRGGMVSVDVEGRRLTGTASPHVSRQASGRSRRDRRL